MVTNSGSDYPGTISEEALSAGLAASRVRVRTALLVGLFLLGWAYVDGVSIYGRLPDRIPFHFGPSGAPDRWVEKGLLPVYVMLLGGAALLLGMAVVSRLPAKWYNFPGKERVLKLPPAQQAYVIAPMQELLGWLGAAFALAFSISARQTWAVALGERPGISPLVMLLPVAVGVVGAVVSIVAARARLRAVEEAE